MAYGFQDDAYFFLKIRAAFPEFPDEPKISTRDYEVTEAMLVQRGTCGH